MRPSESTITMPQGTDSRAKRSIFAPLSFGGPRSKESSFTSWPLFLIRIGSGADEMLGKRIFVAASISVSPYRARVFQTFVRRDTLKILPDGMHGFSQ